MVTWVLHPLLGHAACIEGSPEVAFFPYQEMDSAFPLFQGSNALQGPHSLTSLSSSILAEKRSLLKSGDRPTLLFLSKNETQEGERLC